MKIPTLIRHRDFSYHNILLKNFIFLKKSSPKEIIILLLLAVSNKHQIQIKKLILIRLLTELLKVYIKAILLLILSCLYKEKIDHFWLLMALKKKKIKDIIISNNINNTLSHYYLKLNL